MAHRLADRPVGAGPHRGREPSRRGVGGSPRFRSRHGDRGRSGRNSGCCSLAGPARPGSRYCSRRGLDNYRRAPLRPGNRRGSGHRRHHEPPDQVRRGPDEQGLVRDDEPGRRGRVDLSRPRGARHARGGTVRSRRRHKRRTAGAGAGREPDHAPPVPGIRPDPTSDGTIHPRNRGGHGPVGLRPWTSTPIQPPEPMCCRASPATSVQTPQP